MHLNKVLVLGCSRSGTTEFCKTLQEISSKKFIWEPEFNHSENVFSQEERITFLLGKERFFLLRFSFNLINSASFLAFLKRGCSQTLNRSA